MRPYLGDYLIYNLTPSWPGYAMVQFCRIEMTNGQVRLKKILRGVSPSLGTRYFSKMTGQAFFQESKICITCANQPDHWPVSFEIIDVNKYLTREFMVSRVLSVPLNIKTTMVMQYYWRFLGRNYNTRQALKACGHFSLRTDKIDPVPKRLLVLDSEKLQNGVPPFFKSRLDLANFLASTTLGQNSDFVN